MALTPKEIGGYFDQFMDMALFGQLITWIGYFLTATVVLGVLLGFYFAFKYKYKVTYPILNYESGKETAQIIRYKKDRARTIRHKDGRVEQHILLLNRKTEQFKEEDIIPKNRINILKVNNDGTYIPMPVIQLSEPIADFETLTPEEKHWAILQLKENARTYADSDELKKMRNMVMFTAILCLVLVGITVYLAFKAPNKAAEAADALRASFEGIAGSLGGGTPPS